MIDMQAQDPGTDLVHPNPGVRAAGSDAPEKSEVRVGFMPLTDCAPVIVAHALGLDRKYGLTIVPSKEASWAGIRDKLVGGELDAAHALYGLIYGVHLGIGGPRTDMAVLMTLNQNGQAITLSDQLARQGVTDGDSLAALMQRAPREDAREGGRQYVFAQTFPTGTHAMWLYYWLAAHGIDPVRDARTIAVPPPQMAAHMQAGQIDGFCAGEPWNADALARGIGFTAATTQTIWQDHPEKVLGATAAFVERHPNTARALVSALLEACRFIDASNANRRHTAALIAQPQYVAADARLIVERMLGHQANGLGGALDDPHPMRFFAEGAVNFPYLSDGMWFMTQFKRWGMLRHHPDYLTLAQQVNRVALYRDAAAAASVAVPANAMRTATLCDGVTWTPEQASRYADSFPIRA